VFRYFKTSYILATGLTFDAAFLQIQVLHVNYGNIDIYLLIFIFDIAYSCIAKMIILPLKFSLFIFVYQYLYQPNDMIWISSDVQFSWHQ